MADVFISYSRKNGDFAHRLIDRLHRKGKDAWVDWEGIPLTSPNWWAEIKSGIDAADSFVFIMSPDSMASVVCNMELDYAFEQHKRIIPVVHQEVESRDAFASIADFTPDDGMEERLSGKDPLILARNNWQRLSHINWTFIRDNDDFDQAFEQLIEIVDIDLEYVKAHTRYLMRASEWSREGQRADLLLFGEEIDRAEEWLQKAEAYAIAAKSKTDTKVEVVNPLPRDVQREYIQVSRQVDKRRRRVARSVQVSIGILILALISGVIIAGSIVTQTQDQVADAQTARSDTENFGATVQWEATFFGIEQARSGTLVAGLGTVPQQQMPLSPPEVLATLTQIAGLNAWEPVEMIDDFGVVMVQVPAGCFYMGSAVDTTERPVHEQCFDQSFWIDKYEVTNKQYGSSGYFSGDDLPRESVTWYESRDFCEARGARLPTEKEWEYAARGVDNLTFPWGNEFEWERVVGNTDQTASVGSKPNGASWVGALDMSGNVSEWVSSEYQDYPYDAEDEREHIKDSNNRVSRGGSWANIIDDPFRSSHRSGNFPAYDNSLIGFRCAISY